MEAVRSGEKLITFQRLLLRKELYYCSKYGRVKKLNSFTIKYSSVDGSVHFGFVNYFLFVCNTALAVVSELNAVRQPFVVPDQRALPIVQVTTGDVCVVNDFCIICKCVLIDFGGAVYFVQFPSKVLCD